MGVASRIVLQFRDVGHNNGEVYVTAGGKDVLVYYGPAARTVYEALQTFTEERRQGSGDFYEQVTSSGKQWREKI